jgi:hypothetical protein
VGKPWENRPLGRSRRRWVDNIRMDLGEVGCSDVHWIGVAQDMDSRLSRPEPLRFLSSSSSIVLTRLSGPVPDPLLLRKSGSAENRTRTSGSVARNSDHYTTEAVYFILHNIYKFSSYLTRNAIHFHSAARNSEH